MTRTEVPTKAPERGIFRLALLAAIVESVDDAIISKNLDGVITSWNPAAERMYGYSAEEAVGRPILVIVPPEKEEEATDLIKRISDGVLVVHYETVRLHQSGRLVPVQITVSPVRGDDDRVVGASSIERDITQRVASENRARAAAQYARSLIEASLDPLVTINPDGKITDLNEATTKTTGRSRASLIGTDFSDYFTEPETARETYRQAFAGESVTDYSLTIRHRNGQLCEVLYNASVYKDAGGNVLGVVAAARDITAQRRAEGEVAAQRERELTRLAELERFQQVTIGRELKMVELKAEIAALHTARILATERGA